PNPSRRNDPQICEKISLFNFVKITQLQTGDMHFSGTKIRALREERKWTQKELAEKIALTGHFSGFTHQRIDRLEKGDNASHRVLCALCEVFRVRPGVFFEDGDSAT
ncbi:MAG TPA: helix-turn-helix transcriptional regulator, partial [Leptospiraceae bacterium]|nr:helix-turn-helix transcriptional regulator [Leptospiraceae bacterium]